LVEGSVVFGALVSSVAVVILGVILGLRYLNGTLGGTYALGSLLLTAAFLVVISAVLVLALTNWLRGPGHSGGSKSP